MSADRCSCGYILWCFIISAYNNFKCLFVYSFHKLNIKITKSAIRISFFNFRTYYIAACNIDFITAGNPQKSLCHSFNKCKVFFVVTCTVFKNSCFIGNGITFIPFNSNNKILTIFFSCLSHISAYK